VYDYGYYDDSYTYCPTVSSTYVYESVETAYPTAPVEVAPIVPGIIVDDSGWTAILNGAYEEAARRFGDESLAQSMRAEPRIGYALASAALGHYGRAARSVHRGLWLDRDGVRDLNVDESLRPFLGDLIGQFAPARPNQVSERDAAFMVAALHYLLRDVGAAHETIAAAIDQGDRRPGTTILLDLINEERRPVDVQPQP
jgi:hypothetical protein